MPDASAPRTRRARRVLGALAMTALLVWLAAWSWQQPFLLPLRTLWELSRLPAAAVMPVPVQGVAARDIAATFGAPRGADRQHAGVDIFARRGTPVRSSTRGVITSIRDSGLGGRQVWVLGPGLERYYYAHLDDWAPDLDSGDVVAAGTPLGTVGSTGNAKGTPPHLHFGIYTRDGAQDPLPRLRAGAASGRP
ncbi:M23 family metallopeptidase [Pseudoxanthomonas beigongshangi]